MTLEQSLNLRKGDAVRNIFTGHVWEVIKDSTSYWYPVLRSQFTQTESDLIGGRLDCFELN